MNVKAITFKQTKSGDITVCIPRSYLRHAVTIMDDLGDGTRVTNTKMFSDAIVQELGREDEQGSNAVHLMLDTMIINAIDQGCDGVSLGDDE